jgi:hypothetical protein
MTSPAVLSPDPEHAMDEVTYRLVRADPREAQGLLADGVVRHLVADVHTEIGHPESAAMRARALWWALSPVITRRSQHAATPLDPVIGHRTAAWVHVGGPAPHRIDLVSPPGRARWRDPLLLVHEHRLCRADVVRVAGVQVTSPARTAADLARSLPGGQAIPWLILLHRRCGLRPTAVLAQLETMSHSRGVRVAREVVQQWSVALAETAVSVPA